MRFKTTRNRIRENLYLILKIIKKFSIINFCISLGITFCSAFCHFCLITHKFVFVLISCIQTTFVIRSQGSVTKELYICISKSVPTPTSPNRIKRQQFSKQYFFAAFVGNDLRVYSPRVNTWKMRGPLWLLTLCHFKDCWTF